MNGQVQLQTAGGNWNGLLWDLSETGARVQVENPPASGLTALITWEDHERLCRIVWATGEMCGVVFDRPIPAAAVRGAAGPNDGPQASLGNIPLGQRRSRPV